MSQFSFLNSSISKWEKVQSYIRNSSKMHFWANARLVSFEFFLNIVFHAPHAHSAFRTEMSSSTRISIWFQFYRANDMAIWTTPKENFHHGIRCSMLGAFPPPSRGSTAVVPIMTIYMIGVIEFLIYIELRNWFPDVTRVRTSEQAACGLQYSSKKVFVCDIEVCNLGFPSASKTFCSNRESILSTVLFLVGNVIELVRW